MKFRELPSAVPGMRCWGADVGRYHFVITFEDGHNLRPGDRAEWVGYSASFKSYEGRNKDAVRIDGMWQSFVAAEEACRQTWRHLRAPS